MGSTTSIMQPGQKEIRASIRTIRGVYLVGIAGRFPNANNVEELWEQLKVYGESGITGQSPARWPNTCLPYLPISVGRIKNEDGFDADFWCFSDTKTFTGNPILRHLLEVIYEAVLDSGLPLSTFQSSSEATGLYIAQSSYLDSVITSKQSKIFWEARSSNVPRHISHLLGTRGPAVGIDADTNSSLVAVDIAVRDLQRGAVHYAIVAGGNLVVNPLVAQGLEYLSLGSDGLSHGSQSDGVAAIVLTREMLICNRIYSELLGVGISSDGSRESGISHVDCNSMVELIKETCRNSGVHLEDILYIESSGPGIQSVDEEQMKRLVKTLLKGQKIGTEVICAASTNAIGHCQSAAGLVSIIVSVFAIHYDWVPHCFASRITDLLDAASDVPAETVKDGHTSIKDGATVVISRGLGGTSGCVVLVPFRCKWPQTTAPATVLLPLYARCDVGLDRICKAVENASRFYPEMLLLMEKSVLTSDTLQPTRGYMIISPEMEILVSEKLPPCQVFQPSLTLVLFWGDFSSVEISVDPELWQIPAFEESMKASDKIFEELSMGAYHTIVECMAMSYRKLDKEANNGGSMTHTHIITGTAVQIGLAETVRQACGSWAAVAGGGLGVLAAAYHDGCLTQKQCIQVAYTLSSIAGCWIDDLETSCKYLVALVHLKVDEVYRLGPNIYILAILTDFLAVIGVPRHIPHLVDNVEKQVSLKGGQFKPVINSPFFNPHLLLKIKDLALQRVRRIIPHPKQWSDLALLPLSRSHPNSVTNLLCDAEYIINSILQPLDQPVLMKQLLRESDFVVMAHIPGCEGTILSEGQKSFVQLDTTRILHWSPSLLDVLNVLGKVHTLGCKLDLSAIHHQLEYPLDCSVPPLSPLASWDHRTSWPLPQWMEFTCKEKDEFMTTYRFSIDEGASESSLVAGILYHSWFAIATRLQAATAGSGNVLLLNMLQNMDTSKPTAVRLFSIVEEQDIMLIDSSTPVFLQAQLGCRTFNIFNEDGVILGGRFEELRESPDQPIGDFHYAYCDVNQDFATGLEQAFWTVEWEDDWQLYLRQIFQQLENQTWKEKGDHQMDKGQRLVTTLPEEALFLPQYHAQLLDHYQNSVTVSFEACTGLLRAGGVIFHFPLLPLGMKRRDSKCTEVSTFEESSVEEHGHRQCIFDEKTGLVHVTVTKDSMAFQHPGNRFTASTHPFNFNVQGSLQQKVSFQLEVCEAGGEESKSCSAPEDPSVAFCQAKQAPEQAETLKQIDSISCLEKIGLSSEHANLNEVKTCAADGAEELKGFGAFKILEKTDRITVNHTETVWVCNDISLLLFHGVITATQQQIAGFWSEEYPDTMLEVLVPGWWKPRHQHFLLLWVIAMYIMDMVDLETTHTILVYPPFDSLSFTLLWAASEFRCQVFALTQGSSVPEVFNKICPGVAIISQVFWSQHLPQHGSISGCTCVKWITGDITLAMDQLPSSGRLIQCGQPRNSAHVCVTFNKNKTLVCVDPRQAIRGSIARLSQLKDEAFLHLDCLSSLDSATCELILSLEMSDCLSSGFESQRSAYFNECISLSLVLKVKQSEASYDAVQIFTDSSTANLDFKRAADLEKNNCTVTDKNENKLVELAKFHDCDAGKLGLNKISTISSKFSYPNRIGDPEWGMQSNQFLSAGSDRENLCDFESFPASIFDISEPNICLATGWHEANYLPCRLSNEQVDTSFHTTGAMVPDLPREMEKVTDHMLYMDSLSNCFGQGSAGMQCAPEVPNKLPEMASDASANCCLQTGLPALGTENKDMFTERQIVSLSGFSAYNERYPSDSEMQEVRYFPFLEDDGYSDKDGHQDTSSFSEESYEKDGYLDSHSQMNDKGRELQLKSHSSSSLAAIDNINLKMPYGCSTLMYDQGAVEHQVNFLTNDKQSIQVPRPVAENSSNIYGICTSACPSGLAEASGLWLRNVRMPEGESVCKQSMDFQIPSETHLPLSFNAIQNIEGKEILDSLSSPEKRTSPDNESLANEPSSSQEQQASTTSCEWHDPASQKLGQELLELLEDALEESGLLPLVTSARLTDLGQIQKLTAGTTTTVEVSSQISAETDSSLADHVHCDGYVLVSTADFCSSTTGADFGAVDLWSSGAKHKVQTCATQMKSSFAQSLQDTRIPLCGFDSAPSSFSLSEHTSHHEYPHPQGQTHSTPENLSRLLKNYFETSSGLDTAKTSQAGFEELPGQRTSKHSVTYSMQLATEATCHMAASNEPVEESRCTSGCLDTNQEKPIKCPDSRHQGKTVWQSGHDELSEFTSCLSGSCITQEAERLHGMLESRQSLHCTESSWQEQVRDGEHEETSFSRKISMSESVLLSNSPDSISPRKPAFSLDPFTIRDSAFSSSLSHQQQSSGAISYLGAKSPWSRDFPSMYQFCDDSLGFGRRNVVVKHKSNQAVEGLFHKSKSIDKMSCSMNVDLGLLENHETLKTLDNVEILSLARQPSQQNLGNSSTPKPMHQITGVFLQQSWSDDISSQNCKEYRNLPNPILPELLQSEALVSPPVSFHFNSGLSREEHEESQAEHQEQLASDTDDNIDLDFAFQFDSHNHEDNSVMLDLPRNIPLPLRNLQGQEIEDESSQSGDSGIEFHLTEEISSSNQHRYAFNLVSDSKRDSHLVYSLPNEGLGPITYECPPFQQQLSSPYEEAICMQHQHSAVDVSTDQVQSPGGKTSFMQQTSSGVEHDVDFDRQFPHSHSFSDETHACSQSAHVLQSCLHHLCGGSESLQTAAEDGESRECVFEINKNKASDICQKYFEPNALISSTLNTNEIQVQENKEENHISKSDSIQELQRSKNFFSRIIYQNQEVIPPEEGASCENARYEKELNCTSNTLNQGALLSWNSVLHPLDSRNVEQRITDENSSGVLPACATTPIENLQAQKQFQALQPNFTSLAHSAPHSLLIEDFPSSTPAELQQLNKPSAEWRFKRPLYLVHPITGSIEIFRVLASKLNVCCIGIQRTPDTPTSSVEDVARHYCAAIKCNDRFGPYQLAGYSYGGLLVFEMARQFQQDGKRVELLLMLDGSPDYVKGQIEYIRSQIPANSGQEECRRIMESHFLLHFMDLYGHVLQRTLVQEELERSPSLKERITLAVKLTKMAVKDTSILSSSKSLKQKPSDNCKTHDDALCEAVEKSVDLRHQQKAADFLAAAFVASKYIAVEAQESRFVGDAHLIRIKKCPLRCMVLPADYGLSTLCTGNVKICYVNGDHESIFHDPYVQSLQSIIHAILGKKS